MSEKNIKPGDFVEIRMFGEVKEIVNRADGSLIEVMVVKPNRDGMRQFVDCHFHQVWTAEEEVKSNLSLSSHE